MKSIIENLITAADKAAAQLDLPNHCEWCNREIPRDLQYCEGTDCEYDGEKWRRANR